MTYIRRIPDNGQEQCNSIAQHAINDSVTMRESLKGNIKSEDNPVHLLAKAVNGQNSKHLVSLVFYDIYDKDT